MVNQLSVFCSQGIQLLLALWVTPYIIYYVHDIDLEWRNSPVITELWMRYNNSAGNSYSMTFLQHFEGICLQAAIWSHSTTSYMSILLIDGSSPDINTLLLSLLEVSLNERDQLQVNTKGAKLLIHWQMFSRPFLPVWPGLRFSLAVLIWL